MFTNRFLNIVIVIVMLAVVALTIQEAIATSYITADAGSASRSANAFNPELNVAERFSVERDVTVALDQLVANPELSAAQRYSVQMKEGISWLAFNPELSAANRFAAHETPTGASTFLSTNPELSVTWRHAAKRTGN